MDKTRITFYLTRDIVEKAKDAAFWTPGLTLSGLVEQALDTAIGRLESERGGEFPPREAELVKGRPAK